MRVLIGQLEQEAATFNPAPTVYEMFSVSTGEEIMELYTGTKTQIAAAINLLGDRDDIEIVPCYAAESVSGPPPAARPRLHVICAVACTCCSPALHVSVRSWPFLGGAGGVIPAAAVERLLGGMMDALRVAVAAGPVAAVYLSLHGAMAGQDCPDPEGRSAPPHSSPHRHSPPKHTHTKQSSAAPRRAAGCSVRSES